MGGYFSSPSAKQIDAHEQFTVEYYNLFDQLELLMPRTVHVCIGMDLYVDHSGTQTINFISHNYSLHPDSGRAHLSEFVLSRATIWHTTITSPHGMAWRLNKVSTVEHYAILRGFLQSVQEYINSLSRMTILCQGRYRRNVVCKLLGKDIPCQRGEITNLSKSEIAKISG